MALVFPLLGMLLLGIVTSGLSYSHAIGLSNAVREGSRFGATRVFDNPGWRNAVVARTREVQFDDPDEETVVCTRLLKNNAAVTVTTPAVPSTVISDTICSTGTPAPSLTETVVANSAGGSAPTPPLVGGQQCVVLVWAARPFTINALLFSWDRRMTRQAVARYERTC